MLDEIKQQVKNQSEQSRVTITTAKPEDARGIVEVLYKTWLDTYPNEEAGITVDDIEDKFSVYFTEEFLKI